MSFWTRQETELVLGVAAGDPHTVSCYTNWAYYVTRLTRCEGFTVTDRYEPAGGGCAVSGRLDIGAFSYLWLRKGLSSQAADARFQTQRALLPAEPALHVSQYRPDDGERETTFLAQASEPYWLTVETDAATWLRRMEHHPYAVLLAHTEYADGQGCLRRYVIPRALLTIRKARPQYTDEHRQALRDRLAALNAAA